MPNSIVEILKQLRAIVQTMSAGKMMALFLLVSVTVAGLVVMISWSGKPDYIPLYSHLSPEDASQVVSLLREKKIEYRLSHDGGTIQVPRERIYELRLDLASQGLPRGGTGFEVFDNAKLGMTEFVQNINYQRALQGELSRTINGLSEVDSSARTHRYAGPLSLYRAGGPGQRIGYPEVEARSLAQRRPDPGHCAPRLIKRTSAATRPGHHRGPGRQDAGRSRR